MLKTFYLRVLFTMCWFTAVSLAQTAAPQTGPNTASLCVLQKKLADGEHETVRVSGVYGPGLDHTVLEDPPAPMKVLGSNLI